jgi:hypothetical protein
MEKEQYPAAIQAEVKRGEVAGYYIKKRENVTPVPTEALYAKLQQLVDDGYIRLPGNPQSGVEAQQIPGPIPGPNGRVQ